MFTLAFFDLLKTFKNSDKAYVLAGGENQAFLQFVFTVGFLFLRCVAEFTSSPPAEQASRERSSSADRQPALLASSPDPSHICAPPGSAPPAEE